jgi:anhydro-N-acetylmuramic acid kinase
VHLFFHVLFHPKRRVGGYTIFLRAHPFLISRIQSISNAKITIPNPKIIEFKEALAMSFMALRSIENRPNTLSNTTGSEKDCISGDWIYN